MSALNESGIADSSLASRSADSEDSSPSIVLLVLSFLLLSLLLFDPGALFVIEDEDGLL